MMEMEKQNFVDTIRGMSVDEMKLALKCFDTDMLWDELRERETSSRNIIRGVKGLVE